LRLFRLTSWGQHGAPFEARELPTANHLALQPLQACELTLHRAITPGQGAPGVDGLVIITESFGKTLEGAHRPLRGAGSPGLERLRWSLAHERRKVLR
jgi:hypothetical protein